MPSDTPSRPIAVDIGLLSPATAGHDALVADETFVDALVTAEVALLRATAIVGGADADETDRRSAGWGWAGRGVLVTDHGVSAAQLAAEADAGGNPVIPLVAELRGRGDIHQGATSQDILDTAVMLVAARVREALLAALDEVDAHLTAFARAHRDEVAAARTLTQHAVPTTVGLRAGTWLHGIRRASARLGALVLPAQLGGAAGTLAAFVERLGADAAARLPEAFASELDLAAPDAPWHTVRWPITELGDALTQVIDALGVIAADVATLSRTEIGELSEGTTGGSSAMPHKRNPAASVLVRSAALRAPQLNATLHLAAALAVDERPDGAWHAEWPTLRELERLALGAAAHTVRIVGGLVVDHDAVRRNLARSDGLLVAERLAVADTGLDRATVAEIVRRGSEGDLAADLDAALDASGSSLRAAELLDPAAYTGLAGELVDRVVLERRGKP